MTVMIQCTSITMCAPLLVQGPSSTFSSDWQSRKPSSLLPITAIQNGSTAGYCGPLSCSTCNKTEQHTYTVQHKIRIRDCPKFYLFFCSHFCWLTWVLIMSLLSLCTLHSLQSQTLTFMLFTFSIFILVSSLSTSPFFSIIMHTLHIFLHR